MLSQGIKDSLLTLSLEGWTFEDKLTKHIQNQARQVSYLYYKVWHNLTL